MEHLHDEIKAYFLPERISQVDQDFLNFELSGAKNIDLQTIVTVCKTLDKQRPLHFWDNPFNSIILYVAGLTDTFDFQKARSDTIGGSSPDIDTDYEALRRQEVLDMVIKLWGRENCASIITHNVFKPKSVTDSFFRVTEPKIISDENGNTLNKTEVSNHKDKWKRIKNTIPKAIYGKEASLDEVINGNEEKGYLGSPSLAEDPEFKDWYTTASYMEGMLRTNGVHASGLIISDFPIDEHIPIWFKKDHETQADGTSKHIDKWITQFDMSQAEELGLQKYDFLGIENGSIIKLTCELIEKNYNTRVNPDSLPDNDPKTFELLNSGLLAGIFQMEASGNAKKLIKAISPQNISDLSDINALNRPGPISARLDRQYIESRSTGCSPNDMPDCLANLLQETHYTILYQETVMKICSELAGFSLVEADDIRRAMGKKKKEVLEPFRERFINGCIDRSSLDKTYTIDLWENLVRFADYCLAGDTKVKTLFGNMTIETIVKNQYKVPLYSLDNQGELVVTHPTQWHYKGKQNVSRYIFDTGDEVVCTPNHRFMDSQGEMIPIQDLFFYGKDITQLKL